MAKFARSQKQAASVMKAMQGRAIKSVGTIRNYEQALKTATDYAKANNIDGGLRAMTPEQAHQYLQERSELVNQKTLDMDRQALQAMMHHVTKALTAEQRLPVVRSSQEQILAGRAYTQEQVQAITAYQEPHNALATEIANAAGLRAHELLTLRPGAEQPADLRNNAYTQFKFTQLPAHVIYTVQGKGGLIRNVAVPNQLSKKLEELKLNQPRAMTDRNIRYLQHYAIGGGNAWSNSFSAASQRALGYSHGAHGLRHGYAQDRMAALQYHHPYHDALAIVSQEMGHIRPEITLCYLR